MLSVTNDIEALEDDAYIEVLNRLPQYLYQNMHGQKNVNISDVRHMILMGVSDAFLRI